MWFHLGRAKEYLDVPRQSKESILNVDRRFGGRFHELDPVLYRQLLPSFFGYLGEEQG